MPRRVVPIQNAGQIAGQVVNARKWVTLAIALAFFLQGFAIQTHIHGAGAPAPAKTVSYRAPGPTPLKGQDTNDQCRLCHELLYSGSFITPSALAVPAGHAFILAVYSAIALAAPAPAASFAWQGRAPPRH
ncbi:MAG TPA: hypothetical protein VG821_10420 [Rhizomicrobium sp.]|nr:hypothetical protein [Rhizomicrobium sp.]